MENPKDYRIRLYLPTIHKEAAPHLLDVRPERMAIEYKHLELESQDQDIFYYGLLVQHNVYQTANVESSEFINLVTKGNFSYDWDKNGQCIKQDLDVFYCLRDGSFDPVPEQFPNCFIEDADRNQILQKRRGRIVKIMTSRAIALGVGDKSIPFFKAYSLLTSNYINSGDTELIDTLKAIAPGNEETEWLFDPLPQSERIVAALAEGQKAYLKLAEEQKSLTVKQALILNFWMATLLPSNQEIAAYLSVAGV